MADMRKRLNGYLRGLSKRRKNGVVTADDANTFLDRNNITDTKVRRSITGSIFNTNNEEITKVGTTTSSRPEAKSVRLNTWRYM